MNKFFFLFYLLLHICHLNSFGEVGTDTILHRHRELILAGNENTTPYEILEKFDQRTGKWRDLNYNDKSMAGWSPITHLNRMFELSLAYANPKSANYKDQKLLKTINLALEDWSKNGYQSKNWWYNEIGVPLAMLNSISLLKDEWNLDQKLKSLKIIEQYKINGTGANLTWSASIAMYYGLYTKNEDLVSKASNLLKNEVKISTAEGIQPDFSFHQHGKRLQTSHYGESFLVENFRLAWELRNSKWAYPSDKTAILLQALLKGVQWSARGIHNAPSTLDRSVSRKSALRRTIYINLIPYLKQLYPAKTAKIIEYEKNLIGKYNYSGFRYFPLSDFAAYQKPDFSFFLKTISTRTLATESINNENLKGKLLGSGDTYLIANGNEYFNLMPVWKWNNIPGITTFEGADKIIQKSFNGAVSDKNIGFSAMDYSLTNNAGSKQLSAKKMWASFENVVICLIADIKANTSVFTTLEQSRLQGEIAVDHTNNKIAIGKHELGATKWIYHSNFAYLPIQKDSITLYHHAVSGSWSEINKSESDSIVTENVFMPVLNHSPFIKSTGYVLANVNSPKQAAHLAKKPFYKIIRNDGNCQIVSFRKRTIMASFYNPGSFTYGKMQVAVDQPCLLLFVDQKLYASDPNHKGGLLKIRINNLNYQIPLTANGSTSNPIKINYEN
ncbi:MAG: chondroitin AC lyase [Pedobacter sp.]|nr:MAG: chondroitin AC lyase [Pedobacter sp.]